MRQLAGLGRLDELARVAGLGQVVEPGRDGGAGPGGGHGAEQIQGGGLGRGDAQAPRHRRDRHADRTRVRNGSGHVPSLTRDRGPRRF